MKIVRTKGICGGHPRVSGTRLTVSLILRALAGNGEEMTLKMFPTLSKEAIQLVLTYAAKEIEK